MCRHKGEQCWGIGAEPPWLIEPQIKLEGDGEEGADVEIKKEGRAGKKQSRNQWRGAGV